MIQQPSKSVRILVERFENEWHDGRRPDIAKFFKSATVSDPELRIFADRQVLLHNLVRVDMEFRWQLWQADRSDPTELFLESYAERIPELGQAESWPADLIADEFRIRRRWGDGPGAEQSLKRFPKRHAQLLPMLKRIEEEVAGSAVPLGTAPQQFVGMKFADGRYIVIRVIASGGMGIALLARDANLSCQVVIKIPHRHLMARDKTFEQRFLAEMQSLVDVCHPHIVKITDSGHSTLGPFAVLQFLPGGTLLDWIQRLHADHRTTLPWRELFLWLPSIADVLDYLHSKRKLIHRDVNPKNILFDSEQRSYLSDFGLVRVVSDSSPGHSESIVGTLPYIAPETLKSLPPDGRTDQFAFALTAYYFLTGTWPEKHHARKAAAGGDSPAAGLVALMPAEVVAIFTKALSEDPKNRYSSCFEFTDALRKSWPVSNTIFGTESDGGADVVVNARIAVADASQADTANALRDATQFGPESMERRSSGGDKRRGRRWWLIGACVGIVLTVTVGWLNRPAATSPVSNIDPLERDKIAILGDWRNAESGLKMRFFPDGRYEEQRLFDTGRGTYQILPDNKIRIKTEGALGGLVPTGGEDVGTYVLTDKELTLGGRHGIALSIRFNREP